MDAEERGKFERWGRETFDAGKMGVPAGDARIEESGLYSRSHEDIMAGLGAWIRGWDKANLNTMIEYAG